MKIKYMLFTIIPALLGGVGIAQAELVDAVNMYQGDTANGFSYVDATANFNNSLTTETGDYDFDGTADDRRTYQSITTALAAGSNPFATGAASNRTSVVRAGFQMAVMNNTTITPGFGLKRIGNVAAPNGDLIQLGSGGGSNPMRMVSAVNVAKADFLNGASSTGSLGFDNVVGMKARVATMTGSSNARFLVQSGSDWYISDYSVTRATDMLANGYTETWYSYDPTSTLLYDNTDLGTGVSGSTLTDIQAFGIIAQNTVDVNGTSANAVQFAVSKLSLNVIPEPATLGLLVLGSTGLMLVRRLRL